MMALYTRVKFNSMDVGSEDECWKIWLPEELTKEIMQKSHDSNTSHGGTAKTLQNVRQYFSLAVNGIPCKGIHSQLQYL